MESTADKRGNYVYNDSPLHPHGAWNINVGYGVVDAYKAVKKALETDLFVRDTLTDDGATPSNTTYKIGNTEQHGYSSYC